MSLLAALAPFQDDELTCRHLVVLLTMASMPGDVFRHGDLARAVGASPGALNRACAKLVRLGYIDRHRRQTVVLSGDDFPRDYRATCYRLTALGRDRLAPFAAAELTR